jgi:23S rRNA (cytidine2498-2'-O)-methyltransferase
VVTAVDRAVLDVRLLGAKGLHFVLGDVAGFRPGEGVRYDALLCDMNGDPEEAFAQVLRLVGIPAAGPGSSLP